MCLDYQCFWEIYSLLLLAIFIKMIDYYTPVLGVWERLELFWYRKCRNNDGSQWADPSQFLQSRTLNRVHCCSVPIHCPITNASTKVLLFWQLDNCCSRQYCQNIPFVLNFNKINKGENVACLRAHYWVLFGFQSSSVPLTLGFSPNKTLLAFGSVIPHVC